MTKMEYEINIEFSNVIDYIKFKINELHKLTGKYPDYLILGQLSSNRLNLELGPLKRFNEVETENVIEFCGMTIVELPEWEEFIKLGYKPE